MACYQISERPLATDNASVRSVLVDKSRKGGPSGDITLHECYRSFALAQIAFRMHKVAYSSSLRKLSNLEKAVSFRVSL